MFDFFEGQGKPEDRFYELLHTMNKDVVNNEINQIITRLCALEMLLHEREDLDREVKVLEIEEADALEAARQNHYLHHMANMVSQHE